MCIAMPRIRCNHKICEKLYTWAKSWRKCEKTSHFESDYSFRLYAFFMHRAKAKMGKKGVKNVISELRGPITKIN